MSLNNIDYQVLEARIRSEIDAAISEGWKLVTGSYYDKVHKECCAMGAFLRNNYVLLDTSMETPTQFLMRILDVSRETIIAITHGFDGWPEACGPERQAYELGRRLRETYLLKELRDAHVIKVPDAKESE